MAAHIAPLNLQIALEQHGEHFDEPKSAVLFRRGDRAFGIFVVLRGKVSLDFGVDSPLARSYGPGALLGLPATLTRRSYSMTATVTEDAELAFVSSQALDSLLRERPALCQPLLAILAERVIENNELQKALLKGNKQASQRSVVA